MMFLDNEGRKIDMRLDEHYVSGRKSLLSIIKILTVTILLLIISSFSNKSQVMTETIFTFAIGRQALIT